MVQFLLAPRRRIRTPTNSAARFFYIGASFFLVVAAMVFAKAVVLPITTAVLLTFILSPLVTYLQSKGLWRLPAVMMVVVLVFLVLAGFAFSIVNQFNGLAHSLPEYKNQIIAKLDAMREFGEGSVPKPLLSLVKDVSRAFSQTPDANEKGAEAPQPVVMETSILPLVQSVAGSTLELIANGSLIMLLVIFMLLNREDLRNRIIRLIGHGHMKKTISAFDDSSRRISSYLLRQVMVNAFFGISLAIGCFFIGVPYALTWGLLGGMLRYIPFLGSILAALCPLLLTWAVFPGWSEMILVAACVFALEMTCAYLLEPFLYGNSIGISPVAFLSLAIIWAWIWGPMGLVLSTPITALLVVFSRHFPQLQVIDILLGDDVVLEPPIAFYQRLLAKDRREASEIALQQAQEHGLGKVYETIFIPAIVTLQKERLRGDISEDAEPETLQLIRDILNEAIFPLQDVYWKERKKAAAAAANGAVVLLNLQAIARTAEDQLILEMFCKALDPDKFHLEVLSSDLLLSEILERIEETNDAPLLIGMARLSERGRFMCKKLRQNNPHRKILVGAWGLSSVSSNNRDRWEAVGADYLATSFAELVHRLLEIRAPAHASIIMMS
jgi:predicted PurR-regulated permease PerM